MSELFYSDYPSEVTLGSTLVLEGDESKHCSRVLRHAVGDSINVINGRGLMCRAEITHIGKESTECRVVEVCPGYGSHPYRLTLGVCPTKNMDRFEFMAQKCTEIGLDCLCPLEGERSERRVLKTARLQGILLSATKQSLKSAIPQLRELDSVAHFIEDVPSSSLRLICCCYESEDHPRQSIVEVLNKNPETRDIAILIGPEGDFSPSELQSALKQGWIPVHLGDSRLRTETAAIVAATAVYLISQ